MTLTIIFRFQVLLGFRDRMKVVIVEKVSTEPWRGHREKTK